MDRASFLKLGTLASASFGLKSLTGFAQTSDALSTPPGLILTWQKDPTTTITIDWHRLATESSTPAIIQSRPRGSKDWMDFPARRFPFPHSDRLIDRVEITGLKPATEYEFRGSPGSKVYWFRTMPTTLDKPLVFANGGDMMHKSEWLEQSNRMVMKHNPDFVVWGGDFAYADGDPKKINRWYTFLDTMVRSLVTDDGRVPPLIGCIGNHEVREHYHKNRMKSHQDRLQFAPFYYNLFAFATDPGYHTLDFGNYLGFVFGDTAHTNPIAGTQTEWMRKAIASRKHVPHLIPVYHVPAWPSVREFGNEHSLDVRDNWVPIFEEHGIRLAFENHDHAYKRSVPIFKGKKNGDKGVIYMGDGSWGVEPRKTHPVETTWYLEKAQSVRHAMIITLHKDHKVIDAYQPDGEKIDTVTIKARVP